MKSLRPVCCILCWNACSPQWEIVGITRKYRRSGCLVRCKSTSGTFILRHSLIGRELLWFSVPVPSFIDRYFYDGLRSVCYPGFQCQQYRLSAQTDRRKTLTGSVLKYESIIGKQQSRPENNLQLILESLQHPEKRYRSRFLIPGNEKSYTLDVADIAYFYSENKITFAVTFTGQEHLIDLSLNKLSEQLDPDRFFRANRQILLSIRHHPHRSISTEKSSFLSNRPTIHKSPSAKKDLPIQTMVELLIFRGILLPEWEPMKPKRDERSVP